MSFQKKGPTKGQLTQALTEKQKNTDALLQRLNMASVQSMQHINQLQQEAGVLSMLMTRFSESSEASTDKDFVTLDCVGRTYDEAGNLEAPFDGGTLYGYALDCSAPELMIPGFVDSIVGKSSGEHFNFDITFPEDYNAKNLAGKKANFEVVVLKVFKPAENMQVIRELVKELNEKPESDKTTA